MEDCGPPFQFFTCWKMLKDHPTFDQLKKPAPSPTEVTEQSDDDNGSRKKQAN